MPKLGDAERSYYKRVEAILDGEGDEEEGDGGLFLRNVIEQVISDGAQLVCCDREGSRVMEKVVGHVGLETGSLRKLLEALSEDLFKLATDQFGSHVTEAVLKTAAAADRIQELEPAVLSLCTAAHGHLSEIIVHSYASHVLSTMVQSLGGVYLNSRVLRSRYSQEFRKAKMQDSGGRKGAIVKVVSVPPSFSTSLQAIGKAVGRLKSLPELVTHSHASLVLQVVLRVLAQRLPVRGSKLVRKILRCPGVLCAQSEEEGALPEMFTDIVGSHLMETLIDVVSPELHQHLYDSVFRHRVMAFALHPVANYPLQHLIATANSGQVSMVIDELEELEEVLFAGHTGVVVSLVCAARSCPKRQSSLLHALLRAFHCEADPRSCVPLLLSLTTREVYYGSEREESRVEPPQMTMHGSQLVQGLLQFQDSRPVVSSLLHTSLQELVRLCCNNYGSYLVEAFMGSSTVPLKKKNKLTEKLKTQLVVLCKDVHGSWVVNAVWRHSEVSQKEALARELLAHEEELAADFHGQIVLRNCNISHYKKKQAVWEEREGAAERKRQLFQEIIGESPAGRGRGASSPTGGGRGKRKRVTVSSPTGGGRGKRKRVTALSPTGGGRGKKVKRKTSTKRKVPLFESDSEEELPSIKKRKVPRE